MSRTACGLCQRDISKPALVRCRDAHCPLSQESARGSKGMTLGLIGLGLTAAICFYAVFGGGAGSQGGHAAQRSFSDLSGAVTAGGQTGDAGGGERTWMSGLASLFSPPKTHEAALTTTTGDGPDPRAASRVQTFSCSNAASASRALICTNWDLATADYNLSLAYQAALAHSHTPEALRRTQNAWLARLDALGSDSDTILRAYEERHAELDKTPVR